VLIGTDGPFDNIDEIGKVTNAKTAAHLSALAGILANGRHPIGG